MTTRRRSLADVIEFVDAVPAMLHGERLKRRISLRTAAREIGISPSHLNTIEQGQNYNVGSLNLILEWLNGNHSEERSGADRLSDVPAEDDADTGSDRAVGGGVDGGAGVQQFDADRPSGDWAAADG